MMGESVGSEAAFDIGRLTERVTGQSEQIKDLSERLTTTHDALTQKLDAQTSYLREKLEVGLEKVFDEIRNVSSGFVSRAEYVQKMADFKEGQVETVALIKAVEATFETQMQVLITRVGAAETKIVTSETAEKTRASARKPMSDILVIVMATVISAGVLLAFAAVAYYAIAANKH